MKALALALCLMPTVGQADVLICAFTPTPCPHASGCEEFRITINTHHGADTPHFDYGGAVASIIALPYDAVEAPTYITVGAADREIITLFNGFDAIHTRHSTLDGTPVAQSAAGHCSSFW